MEDFLERLHSARPSNWEIWPAMRSQWRWFAALGAILLIAIPWGIRAQERSLEDAARDALVEAAIPVESVRFTGRNATITADLDQPTQEQANTIVASLNGVAGIQWQPGSGILLVQPGPGATSTTTTVAPDPGAELVIAVKGGKVSLRGVVPTAETIKTLGDGAADLWGHEVTNQIFVDDMVLAFPWLATADDALAVLPTLIDAQLTLDRHGAIVTGIAISQESADAAADRLEEALGPDVPLDNKLTVTPLELPNIEIVFSDGTAKLSGTVGSKATKQAIAAAVRSTDDDLELNNELVVTPATADVFAVYRLPELVSRLGAAPEWTLRLDGSAIVGSAAGGKLYPGKRVRPGPQVAGVAEVLAGFLSADGSLELSIEVESAAKATDNEVASLAQPRASALAAHMVRLGIDPDRIQAAGQDGDREVLRFTLTSADS